MQVNEGYYDNGQLKYTVPIENNKYHGELVQYYPNGKVEAKISYVRGKKTGYYISYDSLGFQENKIQYLNNFKHGTYKIFYRNGNLMTELGYKSDTIDGPGIDYYQNGSIYKIYCAEMGEPVYLKGYDSLGRINQSMISVEVIPVDSLNSNKFGEFHKILIGIKYSFGNKNRVGVTIGSLNASNYLIDTLKMIGSNTSELYCRYQVKPVNMGENEVTGVVYEIKMPNEEIIGEMPFRYSYFIE